MCSSLGAPSGALVFAVASLCCLLLCCNILLHIASGLANALKSSLELFRVE